MKKKILIVDEEIDTSEVMKSLLDYLKELNAYEIIKSESIEVAKDFLEKVKFDFIILDIMMPHKSLYSIEKTRGGLETGKHFLIDLRNLRFSNINFNTPVIIYTNADKELLDLELNNKYVNVTVVSKPYKYEIVEVMKKYD